MGRKVVLEVCQVCGGQARKINYMSSSKGKSYHYSKFVHLNGVVHYYRQTVGANQPNSTVPTPKSSIFDSLEEIVEVKMRGRELRFGEIKSYLEDSYGKSVGTATIYRNINKLLRLELISKRIDRGIVLYGRKSERSTTQEIRTTKMSIGLDFSHDETLVTMFLHIKNLGLRLVAGYMITLPVGGVDSLDQLKLNAFDETKRIPLTKENISYSSSDQTGISITLNRPLRKSEEEDLFLSYIHRFGDGPIKIMIPSEVDILKINCEVEKGKEIQIKKRLLDGIKEIEPMIVKRSGTVLGQTIVEAKFENATRGDTVVISLDK